MAVEKLQLTLHATQESPVSLFYHIYVMFDMSHLATMTFICLYLIALAYRMY